MQSVVMHDMLRRRCSAGVPISQLFEGAMLSRLGQNRVFRGMQVQLARCLARLRVRRLGSICVVSGLESWSWLLNRCQGRGLSWKEGDMGCLCRLRIGSLMGYIPSSGCARLVMIGIGLRE